MFGTGDDDQRSGECLNVEWAEGAKAVIAQRCYKKGTALSMMAREREVRKRFATSAFPFLKVSCRCCHN